MIWSLVGLLQAVAAERPSVRPAEPEDVPRLREIFRASAWSNIGDRALLHQHPELLEWSGQPALDGRTRVALIGDEVVGFVSVIVRGETVDIEDLFVDPPSMRLGIASMLVEDVATAAIETGAVRLLVDANLEAVDFYRRVGFSVEAEVPLEHGSAMRMRRELRR